MIITTKKREDNVDRKTYYKAKCNKCGAEFIFTSDDILGQERRLNGTKWIGCPECGECIYWSPNCVSSEVVTISKEEYEAIATSIENKEEE
jgi:DNA-directed RNA polymerase subunit RPC12/RpoP